MGIVNPGTDMCSVWSSRIFVERGMFERYEFRKYSSPKAMLILYYKHILKSTHFEKDVCILQVLSDLQDYVDKILLVYDVRESPLRFIAI